MKRIKEFDTGRIPWDISIITVIENFDVWAKHPRATIRFKDDGTKVYVYIRTLTEYQATNK
jgi:hypothetical protein